MPLTVDSALEVEPVSLAQACSAEISLLVPVTDKVLENNLISTISLILNECLHKILQKFCKKSDFKI
jgi:hypothetical protein